MKHTGQESGGELCEIFKLWSFLRSKSVNNVCKLLQLSRPHPMGSAPQMTIPGSASASRYTANTNYMLQPMTISIHTKTATDATTHLAYTQSRHWFGIFNASPYHITSAETSIFLSVCSVVLARQSERSVMPRGQLDSLLHRCLLYTVIDWRANIAPHKLRRIIYPYLLPAVRWPLLRSAVKCCRE